MAKTKRLLSLLLAVAMVLSLMPAIAFAAEENWTDWTDGTTLPGEDHNGNFRLETDVVVSTPIKIPSDKNTEIVIDLNGHTVTSNVTENLYETETLKDYTTNLTFTGEGTVNLTAGGRLAYIHGAGTSTLTIAGGTYNGGTYSGTEGTHRGGVLRVNGSGNTIRISGGTINGATGGVAAGGAIDVYGSSKLIMTGGTIQNGKANNGGNVAVQSSGNFDMSGGQILEGTATHATNARGGNVFVDSSTFNISGDAKIYDGTASNTNYNSQNVWLNKATYTIAIDGDGRIGDNRYDTTNMHINGVNSNPHIACECGSKTGDHLEGCSGVKNDDWTVNTYEGNVVATNVPRAAGRYYLVQDITFNKSSGQALAEGAEVYLDLNGFDIIYEGTSNRLWNVSGANAKLTISDSSSGESVIDLGAASGMAALANVSGAGAKLVLYGGTVDGSKVTADKGAVIYNAANSTTEIYGGEIIGGQVTEYGGAIYNSGNMTIGGGKIHSGIAGSEGTGKGGNIYTDGGVITMTDGEIYNGTANRGANVYVSNNAVFNLEGGEIYTGGDTDGVYDPKHSACICGNPENHLPDCDTVEYSDWQVWNSSTMPTESGRYFLDENLTVTDVADLTLNADIHIDLNGYTITSTAKLWEMTTADTSGRLTISDSVGTGKVILGNEDKEVGYGALVYMSEGDWDFYLYGGTIDGTYTTCNGANYGAVIRNKSDNGNVNIHGGTIIGSASGTATGGGAIGMNAGTLYMTGGEIRGGVVSDSGGNIRFSGKEAIFTMTGGTISGGTANKGGNVYLSENAIFSNDGGTITGGTSLVHEDGDVYREFYLNVIWMNGETEHKVDRWAYYKTITLPEAPTKEADAQYVYEFVGWDADGDGVVDEIAGTKLVGEKDATVVYNAVYNKIPQKYTVTWVDEDGTELEVDTDVEYGTTPTFDGELPTKEGNAQYSYSFAGWTPAVDEVTGNMTYTATYTETVNKYTVTWNVDGVETTEEYEYGAKPEFKGSTDKAADESYTYEFTGWDAEPAPVTGDVTYTAQYKATEIETGPVYDELLTSTTSLGLDSYIGVQIVANSERIVAAGYDRVYAVVVINGEPVICDINIGEGTTDNAGNPKYVYEYKAAPKYMGTELQITLYAELDGKEYVGETRTWSIQSGIMEKLNTYYDWANNDKYPIYGKATKVLVDMLYYGAAAQVQFGEDENGLVTDILDLEENTKFKAFATVDEPAIEKENTATEWKVYNLYQYNLGLEDTVNLQFTFRLNDTDYSTYTVKVTHNGTEYVYGGEKHAKDFTVNQSNEKVVTVVFDELGANLMRDEVTVELYKNGALVSPVYTASIEGTAKLNIQNEKAVDLVKAMMRYGDSAAVYLAN